MNGDLRLQAKTSDATARASKHRTVWDVSDRSPKLSPVKISKRSHNRFADLAAGNGTLREIKALFEDEDFVEREVKTNLAERRTLVARFLADFNPSRRDHQARLLRVYLTGIEEWGWYRGVPDELSQDGERLIKSLQKDGAPIDGSGSLTGELMPFDVFELARFNLLTNPDVLNKHLDRIGANLAHDPAAAIAASKELLESTCKFILDDHLITHSKRDDLMQLYKKAASVLKLNREAVLGSKAGSESAARILQNLATTVQAMAELRNELGLGHGRTENSAALERHARLSFNATRAVVEFLLETWHVRDWRAGNQAAA